MLDSRAIASAALDGVGDPALGEWVEVGSGTTVHVRRRLSAVEQEHVGDVRDIRDTLEERGRFAVLFRDAPHLRELFA